MLDRVPNSSALLLPARNVQRQVSPTEEANLGKRSIQSVQSQLAKSYSQNKSSSYAEAEAPARGASNTALNFTESFRQRLAWAIKLWKRGRLHAWKAATKCFSHTPAFWQRAVSILQSSGTSKVRYAQGHNSQAKTVGKPSQLLSGLSPGSRTGFWRMVLMDITTLSSSKL